MTPDEILDRIRGLYFAADERTIANDFAEAIDWLKQLPDEATRERATVFMEGLAQMRSEWAGDRRGPGRERAGRPHVRKN